MPDAQRKGAGSKSPMKGRKALTEKEKQREKRKVEQRKREGQRSAGSVTQKMETALKKKVDPKALLREKQAREAITQFIKNDILGYCITAAICYGESLDCLLYTSPSPRDQRGSRMPSSA